MTCTADAEIHQGAVAPYAVFYTVTSTAASWDLTTVTAASYDIKRGSGLTGSWSATIEGTPTATSLQIKHEFVAGDVPDVDTITLVPRLVTAGGALLAEPKLLKVRSQFD